jgi:hypothetical protein
MIADRVVPAVTEVVEIADLVDVATPVLEGRAEHRAVVGEPHLATGEVLLVLEGVAEHVGDDVGAALEVLVQEVLLELLVAAVVTLRAEAIVAGPDVLVHLGGVAHRDPRVHRGGLTRRAALDGPLA